MLPWQQLSWQINGYYFDNAGLSGLFLSSSAEPSSILSTSPEMAFVFWASLNFW